MGNEGQMLTLKSVVVEAAVLTLTYPYCCLLPPKIHCYDIMICKYGWVLAEGAYLTQVGISFPQISFFGIDSEVWCWQWDPIYKNIIIII